jgi:hypothetical protein
MHRFKAKTVQCQQPVQAFRQRDIVIDHQYVRE